MHDTHSVHVVDSLDYLFGDLSRIALFEDILLLYEFH